MTENIAIEDILDLTKKIASEELAPRAETIDKEGEWPEKSIRALQDAGLGGLVIPAKYGGHGHGLTEVAKVCEILGRQCASTAICFGMHLVGSAVIAAKATAEQQEKYLVPIAEGEHLTTLSLSEPDTGSNLYIPQAELTNKDNGYTLNGTKAFVTNGGHADSYVVSAVTPDPETPIGEFSCVVVPNDSKGMKWGKHWEGIGMKGNSSRTMELNNLSIPEENLLGEEGDQLWYVFEVIMPYFVTAMAGTYLGIASAAIDEVTTHLKERTHSHSGLALAQQPVVQNKVGELWANVESVRQLVYSAADKGDTDHSEAAISLFSAKSEVSDCCVNVVNEVMTLMGGKAYAKGGKVGRLLRDARASHVMSPTTAMLRTWTGRALLDIPLLGE